MSLCATSLVTHGMICCIPSERMVSVDQPDIVGVVEVRPKIRRAAAPEPTGALEPVTTTAQELKPSVGAQAEPAAQPNDPPSNISAQELKPSITEAKEDD
jgi:hypothetical protein